jgi:hypothetical protein
MNSKLTTHTILLIGILGVIVVVIAASPRLAAPILQKSWELARASLAGVFGRGPIPPDKVNDPPNGGESSKSGSGARGQLAHDAHFAVGHPPAQQILERAIIRLEAYRAIAARTRQAVDLYGERLVGAGEYLEQRGDQGRMFRLELKIQLDSDPSTLLQVSDGRYLWRSESYRGKGTAERIDLAKVAQAMEGQGGIPDTGKIGTWPGLGGLPKLLRSLHQRFEFAVADQATLPDRERTPVIRLRGDLVPLRPAANASAGSSAATASKPPGPDKTPAHLPHYVVLYLGKEDLFPFRIEYRRHDPKPSARLGAPVDQTIASMDLFEVTLNVPASPTRFFYNPGNLDYSDQTDRFLAQLGLKKP